jgi:DNA-binding NarL/FixJ family response regulator
MFEDPGRVREFLGLGASAYVTKSASPEHLVDAIRAAVSDPKGEHVVVAMPRGLFREGEEGGSGGVLSARQAQNCCSWRGAYPTTRSPPPSASPRRP